MIKNLTLLITIALLITSCSKKEPQDPDTVYEAFKAEENIEKRVEMFELFSETNPENAYLSPMLSKIISTLSQEKSVEGHDKIIVHTNDVDRNTLNISYYYDDI